MSVSTHDSDHLLRQERRIASRAQFATIPHGAVYELCYQTDCCVGNQTLGRIYAFQEICDPARVRVYFLKGKNICAAPELKGPEDPNPTPVTYYHNGKGTSHPEGECTHVTLLDFLSNADGTLSGVEVALVDPADPNADPFIAAISACFKDKNITDHCGKEVKTSCVRLHAKKIVGGCVPEDPAVANKCKSCCECEEEEEEEATTATQ